MQIDDLLSKLDNASSDLDRLRDEKDQEISLLQEGMDATIQQLHEAQQVCVFLSPFCTCLNRYLRIKGSTKKLTMPR